MEWERSFGRMVVAMKDNGGMIRLTAKESLSMLMATSTKASGLMTRPRVWALTHMPTELTTRVNGLMISSMVTVSNLGLMAPVTKEITKMERRKDRAG